MRATIQGDDGFELHVEFDQDNARTMAGFYCQGCAKFYTFNRAQEEELLAQSDPLCPKGHPLFSNDPEAQEPRWQHWTEWDARQIVRVHAAPRDAKWQMVGKVFHITRDQYRDHNGYCPLHAGPSEPGGDQCFNPHDHCVHGVYVGGCGHDYMCGKCEMGDEDNDE